MAPALHCALGMRIKSLLLTFGILGSSSIALADHQLDGWRDRSDRSARFDRDRFDRGRFDRFDRFDRSDRFERFGRDRSGHRPTTWIALSPQLQLDRGGIIDVHARARFRQLRLQNQTGRTAVRAIIVVLDNGERHRVDVGRVLVGNHDMVNLDLPGGARRIDRVIVLGHSRRGGSYQLYAM